jgi:ATP-dependent Zn protease
MSGADLMNVMNEAAIICARNKKTMIDMEDVFNAIDRI